MRLPASIVILALGIGAVAGLGLTVTGLQLGIIAWPIALGVGLVLAGSILLGYAAMDAVRELVKQIAIWLAVVTLLPLVVWYTTSAFSPPPDSKEYAKATARIDEQLRDARSEGEKAKLRQEKDRLDQENEEAQRVYYRDMFWVAYPVGLLALIVGTFFPVQAVGSGLMFGGLSSLAVGCYAYWDRMGDWLRLGSLAVAFVTVLALGTWRFGKKAN